MCMTRICFSLTLLIALSLSAVASAQQPKKRIEWPKTFSGQPDFDFEKTEVITERKIKNAEGEEVLFEPSTWKDVLQDKDISPFPRPKSKTRNLTGITLKNADSPYVDDSASFDISNKALPTLNISSTLDLTAFKTFLEAEVMAAAKNSKPRFEEVNVMAILGKIRIQTIASSPNKYAMINNKKYTVGENLKAPVLLPPTMEEIEAAVAEHMPDKTYISPSNWLKYEEIQTDVIADFKTKFAKNPKAYSNKHYVPITIKSIKSRSIKIKILGKTHEVKLKYAF